MKNQEKIKRQKRLKRRKRVRFKVRGTKKRPRLSVFRSLKHIYTQLINDEKGVTLLAVSDRELKNINSIKPDKNLNKKEKIAFAVGELLAQKALKKKIKKVIFDRGKYKYHGRIKALAQGAREKGLIF